METAKNPVKGDRPFPWLCPTCMKQEVFPTTIPYSIDVKHDGTTYTLNLSALDIPQCRSCGELLFDDRADEQINEALRSRIRLLAPAELIQRRMGLGLNQKELADKLGVAEVTIARWEAGALIQSRAMDNLLRVFFDLPEVRAMLVGINQDQTLGTGFRHSA